MKSAFLKAITLALIPLLASCQSAMTNIDYSTGGSGCKKNYTAIKKADAAETNARDIRQDRSEPLLRLYTEKSFDLGVLMIQAIGNGYELKGICSFYGESNQYDFTNIHARSIGAAAAISTAEFKDTQVYVTSEGGGSVRIYKWVQYFFDKLDDKDRSTYVYYLMTNGSGFIASDLSEEQRTINKRNSGSIVTAIIANSPAFFAELHVNDIIVGINNTEIRSYTDLREFIKSEFTKSLSEQKLITPNASIPDLLNAILNKSPTPTGSTMSLKVIRDGSEATINIQFMRPYTPDNIFS